MTSLDKIRSARSATELAPLIEPLAVNMATLADDARSAMENLKSASSEALTEMTRNTGRTIRETAEYMSSISQSLKATESTVKDATQTVRYTLDLLKEERRQERWNTYLRTALTALVVSLIAPSVLGLWQRWQQSAELQKSAENWEYFKDQLHRLPEDKQKKVIEMVYGKQK